MVGHCVVIYLPTELVAPIKTTCTMINCLYAIRLRNYGIALTQAICVIVKYFGKLLLKIIFSSYSPRFFMDKNYPQENCNLKEGTIIFFKTTI